MVINTFQSVSRVMTGDVGETQANDMQDDPRPLISDNVVTPRTALKPELASVDTAVRTAIDISMTANTIQLHLYSAGASEGNYKQHGIARFALNGNDIKFKSMSDGASEVQVVLKSFTMGDIRPGTKFREVIPAAQHQRNQLMVLYTSSGGISPSNVAVINVDTPQFILAIELVFTLLDFITSPFQSEGSQQRRVQDVRSEESSSSTTTNIEYRIDLHDLSVSILADDQDVNSQAARLHIGRISVSQQGILALDVGQLGMSLTRMGKGAEEVRLLDDLDVILSLQTSSEFQRSITNIEFACKPIVLRASYRDIRLILTIAEKVTTAYSKRLSPTNTLDGSSSKRPAPSVSRSVALPNSKTQSTSRAMMSTAKPLGKASVLLTSESIKATVDGFKLILIGDLHEQPMLYLQCKPFRVDVKDWSGKLDASTTVATRISYWNLSNSHWEPLIDPWILTASLEKPDMAGALIASLSSRERLNVNISTTSVEIALDMLRIMTQQADRFLGIARGSYAPYRIRNRTGVPLYIWADVEGSMKTDSNATMLSDGQSVEWRFDDWRTMREHATSGENNIAIQFIGQSWEQLRGVPVDREGEFMLFLRPRTETLYSRLLYEVKVEEGAKVVTLQSTFKIKNQTLYPLEIGLSDEDGRMKPNVVKLAPGNDYSLPVNAVGLCKFRIQPDSGFGYKWSTALHWIDLISRQSFTLLCPHTDQTEAAFRFHAYIQTDSISQPIRRYPKITLSLRAPIELENLLPYNIQYRIYDKDTDQNWRSYLRQGGVMPVHSVELSHLVLLNIEIEETVFKPSEFSIINTDGNSDFDIEKHLTLTDLHGRKLDLMMNYVKYPDAGGAFKVQIYSPYVVVNKTGQVFGVRSARINRVGAQLDAAGDTRPEVLSSNTPFLLSHPSDGGKEFLFRVGDSLWSKTISLDAPAAESELAIPSESQQSQEVHIGLSWTEGLGKYKLTKVITLAPRFFVQNKLPGMAIFAREHGVAPHGRPLIKPGELVPIFAMRAGYAKLVTVAFPGLGAQWSPPISVEDIGQVYFRLRESGEHGSVHLVCADINMSGATIFVSLKSANDDWPFVVENDSNYPIVFRQTDALTVGEQSNDSHPGYELPDHSLTPYAWDYPAAAQKKIQLRIYDARRDVDILEIGPLIPFGFTMPTGAKRAVSLDVRAEGRKQILRVSNYNRETSVYQPRGRNSGAFSTRAEAVSSQDAFEAVTQDTPPTLAFKINFEGIGISLVNRRLVEIVYLTLLGLRFEYTSSPVAQAVNLSCANLQVDNQLHDALFPVFVQPTPLSKAARDVVAPPTIQGSVIWLNDQEHGVLFVKYCSVLLQALTVEADEDFLFALYELSKIKGLSWEQEEEDVLIEYTSEIPEPHNINTGRLYYFEVLELQPIRLSLSFMRIERVSAENKLSVRNPLAIIVNALTMTIGNVNDAPLEMNALAMKDVRTTISDLQTRILYHYRQEVIRQLYRIIGSADFIGNPVGLFTNVSSGVADIFYEPFNGVVMHGNRELGVSIAKGAASFVKKTVFGFSDSFTKVTGSIGKGLSAATLDSEYQSRRRMTQRRNKPRHAIYGVTAGAEAFANSVASGVEGIVMKPLEGAESEGALGFFKGVGKGLVGVVTKPVVGVFDLASNVSEGVRNTTTIFDSPARERVRLPRLVPADHVLVPYSARDAQGQYWMKDVDHGNYRQEAYIAHINLPGGDNVILLTNMRVLSFWTKRLRLEWDLPFSHVQAVTAEDQGIRFAHRNGKAHDKYIFIPDKTSQSWFFKQIAGVVKSFSARRRLEGG